MIPALGNVIDSLAHVDPTATVHPTADIEAGAIIGAGSRVWHQAQVRAGARIGGQCVIGKNVYVGRDVAIGDRCKIQNNALIYEGTTLASGVFVGPAAILTNDRTPRAIAPDGHLLDASEWSITPIRVDEGASIGAGAIIVAGVSIGAWSMIGAGAVVTRTVAPHAIVIGVPGRAAGFACRCGRRLADESAGLHRCAACGRVELLGTTL
ncbi:MAG: N-acetyltransferase [Chloroflexi bacterium]|nr:N-acetyltransferase [Chloroflexota bacterium]